MWFTEAHGDRVGRITTKRRRQEVRVPTARCVASDVTVGPGGALGSPSPAATRSAASPPPASVTEYPLVTPRLPGAIVASRRPLFSAEAKPTRHPHEHPARRRDGARSPPDAVPSARATRHGISSLEHAPADRLAYRGAFDRHLRTKSARRDHHRPRRQPLVRLGQRGQDRVASRSTADPPGVSVLNRRARPLASPGDESPKPAVEWISPDPPSRPRASSSTTEQERRRRGRPRRRPPASRPARSSASSAQRRRQVDDREDADDAAVDHRRHRARRGRRRRRRPRRRAPTASASRCRRPASTRARPGASCSPSRRACSA